MRFPNNFKQLSHDTRNIRVINRNIAGIDFLGQAFYFHEFFCDLAMVVTERPTILVTRLPIYVAAKAIRMSGARKESIHVNHVRRATGVLVLRPAVLVLKRVEPVLTAGL